ncbi:hypothetical protein HMSSN036_96870 [Paenibacillus macerans]|nr:hypothetical protein HMSSN036_96870 [Paenibacillus macerans]
MRKDAAEREERKTARTAGVPKETGKPRKPEKGPISRVDRRSSKGVAQLLPRFSRVGMGRR